MLKNTRKEKDSMGTVDIPSSSLYGASTQRAVLNFPVSKHQMPTIFIHSFAYLKSACAFANEQLKKLDKSKSSLIQKICQEIYEGKLDEHFIVDVFQTGSGTSSNMNINEVISNRACQLSSQAIGSKNPIHPNDDVNMGQSSNDTVPTALHISLALALRDKLIPQLKEMELVLGEKEKSFKEIIKIGRTHLMDATPLSLGQVFSGYKRQVKKSIMRAEQGLQAVLELAIGGTAVGTGINCHRGFAQIVVEELSQLTQIKFREVENHFEAQSARDDAVELAGYLNTICASLTKIANDIRFLASGPRSGLGELLLPAVQPGSSIMPGKVNPVMSEMLIQVAIYVQGLMQSVIIAGRDGHFELNATIPIIAHCLHESIECLSNSIKIFTEKCLTGIKANESRCQELVDQSLMLATALNEHIGYDQSAIIAKTAYKENKTLKEVLLEKNLMNEKEIEKILNPKSMLNNSK